MGKITIEKELRGYFEVKKFKGGRFHASAKRCHDREPDHC